MGIPWLLLLVQQAFAQMAAALQTQAPPLQGEAGLASKPPAPMQLKSRGSGASVEVPWLQVVGTSPGGRPALEGIQTTSGQTDSVQPSLYEEHGPLVGYREPANWKGLPIFTEALSKDVDPELAKALAACPMIAENGDCGIASRCHVDESKRKRIWIVVSTENNNAEHYWEGLQKKFGPNDKALILGPWWNVTHENFTSRRVSSIWLPYASTSFGLHQVWTPMDLWDRSKLNWKAPRPYLVAYQNQHCVDRRETYWDSLNQAMNRSEKLRKEKKGYYLGTCNGKSELGQFIKFPFLDNHTALAYDESVNRYKNFKFILSAENSNPKREPNGYITEKIVNAYLSGAVPIYWGVSLKQLERIFLPGTYIWVETENKLLRERSIQRFLKAAEDPKEYERLLHREGPLVSNASMQRFFSWHPAVWPHFGDGLRQDILHAALKLCQS